MLTSTTKERLLLSAVVFNAFIFLLLASFTTISHAESERTDFDLDNDGLIEINDLADLDEIRNHLDGKALYGKNVGCPDGEDGTVNGGCIGFELTKDLDFDTNQDGEISELDKYWNEGEGWLPIGKSLSSSSGPVYSEGQPFIGVFEGNGFLILNLYIYRPYDSYVGLFSTAQSAKFRRFGITGQLSKVVGRNEVGLLMGRMGFSDVQQMFATGKVYGSTAASFAGYTYGSKFENCFSTGLVDGGRATGGIIGDSRYSTINRCFSTSKIMGHAQSGSLVGYVGYSFEYGKDIKHTYWATDISGQARSSGNLYRLYEPYGATIEELKCPTSANNYTCSSSYLFQDWYNSRNDDNKVLWGFGNSEQLPGLRITDQVYRDSDGDGVLDRHDDLPRIFAASLDSDKDGYPDRWNTNCDLKCREKSGLEFDAFPSSKIFAIDNDLDGHPDYWNEKYCDSSCQLNSSIALDEYLDDFDNDGLPDLLDNDDNNDGAIDADRNSNGLIEIDSLEALNAIRYHPNGTGIKFSPDETLDSSGCPATSFEGIHKRKCIGYELTKELNFDTNNDFKLDVQDTYWNEGKGWIPIELNSASDVVFFKAGGHLIRNLYVNDNQIEKCGLFSSINNGVIINLGFTGPNTYLHCSSYVGALAGSITRTKVENTFSTGTVESASNATGGLLGYAYDSKITNVFTSNKVFGDGLRVGGIAGYLSYTPTSNLYSIVRLSAYNNERLGALFGYASTDNINTSYWSTDLSGASSSHKNYSDEKHTENGTTLSNLKCPTSANNTSCSNFKIYENWQLPIDGNGNKRWDFGTTLDIPALRIAGKLFRDSDSDGYLDHEDSFPYHFEAHLDNDSDGRPDKWNKECDTECISKSSLKFDAFPNDYRIAIDSDLDGMPDEYNTDLCDSSCQREASYTLDFNPFDFDNDGLTDNIDKDDNEDGIIDADRDSDGLIEVYSLEQFNQIRFELEGKGRKTSEDAELNTSGCPIINVNGEMINRCHGYELIKDINFDTNQDNIISSKDLFWNDGNGWEPIGSADNPFSASFVGNGKLLKNFYVNRPKSWSVGIFGYTDNAEFKTLGVSGALSEITGERIVGGLAGIIKNTDISRVFSTAKVEGESETGGLIGKATYATIQNCFFSGEIKSTEVSLGLVGYGSHHTTVSIEKCYATVNLTGFPYFKGIRSSSNSYWATKTTYKKLVDPYYLDSSLKISELACPISANNTSCSDTELYKGWSTHLWDFGDSTQLPGLKLGSKTYRDSDLDGVVDINDKFPHHWEAYGDRDDDGAPDLWNKQCDISCLDAELIPDAFPLDKKIAEDSDLDGLPDSFNESFCDQDCRANTSIALDSSPYDIDNDGILDINDSNENGSKDIDSDSDGLIDIYTLSQLNAIRFQLSGQGLKNSEDVELNTSGCPPSIVDGFYKIGCHGYELMNNLNLDTNNDLIVNEFDFSWNGEDEWIPIGQEKKEPFTGIFNGNGFKIENLNINSYRSDAGLFSEIKDSQIYDLAITGPQTSIQGAYYSGSVAGKSKYSSLSRIFFSGQVKGYGYTGSLIGDAKATTISHSFTSGQIVSHGYYQGMVAGNSNLLSLDYSLSVTYVDSERYRNKISAYYHNIVGTTKSSYWLGEKLEDDSSITMRHLQCFDPQKPLNCDSPFIYSDWEKQIDSDHAIIWDFGSSEQLPGIKIGDKTYRDSDGDGLLDDDDYYPQISIQGFEDTDNDGIPDSCGETCKNLGLSSDADDDNDGIPDSRDSYPTIHIGGYLDTDNDGAPDTCYSPCRYTGMQADNDDDNDGVDDYNDPSIHHDNGAPELLTSPTFEYATVNNADLDFAYIDVEELYNELSSFDAYNSEIEYRFSIEDTTYALGGRDFIKVPLGINKLIWTAVDSAGNISNSLEQLVKVYPRVQFDKENSVVGESLDTKVSLSLTGPSPDYPVFVKVKANIESSTVKDSDLDKEFNLEKGHSLEITSTDSSSKHPSTEITIPLIQDHVFEVDEYLQLHLIGTTVGNDELIDQRIKTLNNHDQMTIVVTDDNLPPEVELSISQSGIPFEGSDLELNVDSDSVHVSLRVRDPNSDVLTWEWQLEGFEHEINYGALEWSFTPSKLEPGDYVISVQVTDNGNGQMKTKESIPFTIVENEEESPEGTSTDSDNGSGAMLPGWIVLLILLYSCGLKLQSRRSFK